MPFKRYVEIGRVGLVNYGKDYGKLVVIVDVIDQNRGAIADCYIGRFITSISPHVPEWISLLLKRLPKSDVKNKWESSSWGRKLIVQKKRASLNDFDRFKIMLAKIKEAGVVRQELAKLKKETTA
ncbi:Ribosomal protein L14 [Cynara cardunculus var. scolymus]|uniref:Ribosomal protein L14 n=1 Tax=Cynara cardunculus var. scolymus TaxID=59895 RepID=A0A103Y7D9_CYNCS|nr:Ribosomal protein L14 [Cynara cardunculus var. scolymus]